MTRSLRSTMTTNKLLAAEKPASQIVMLIVIMLLAWVLGSLIWTLSTLGQPISKWQPSGANVTLNQPVQTGTLTPLIQSDLFGRYRTENSVVAPVTETISEVPETELNLELAGVVATSDKEKSLAVIANQGKQNTYGLGEVIDGTRASLKAVYPDRVIIDNRGRDETLMLEGIDYSQQPITEPKKIPSGMIASQGNNSGSSEAMIAKLRQDIVKNPQAIMQYIRLSQVNRNGEIVGYRVSPGKNRQIFDLIGLKPGDVAMSLNGTDLTDPNALSSIWQSFSSLTELSLTVERNGQTHNVYLPLN